MDLGPGSVGPAIDHEGLDRGLDWDMGLERKSMLHMELLQPPMLLFTTRMLPLPLDPFYLYGPMTPYYISEKAPITLCHAMILRKLRSMYQ